MNHMNIDGFIDEHQLCLVYFAGKTCGVCQVIRPQVETLATSLSIPLRIFDVESKPAISAQHRVFSLPTLLIFTDGREAKRFARHFHMSEVEQTIRRLHRLAGR